MKPPYRRIFRSRSLCAGRHRVLTIDRTHPRSYNDHPPSLESRNPVQESAEYALKKTRIVGVSEKGVKAAARYIHRELQRESYTRGHGELILFTYWIFLISSLNFSFWSEREGTPDRYGVEWREGWASERRTVHTGYWSLVAAVDRALDENIPITDPAFYASKSQCPDSLIKHIFRPASQCKEDIPLLDERIRVLRENGAILCTRFGGSFQLFFKEFQRQFNEQGTALQLVQFVTDAFPLFRDETLYEGHRVCLWKRAQILVAETWAAFYPPSPFTPHPLFPYGHKIHELTMFADYRVPQILHHLRILTYPPALAKRLKAHMMLPHGCTEELSIRAASIVAVERVRREIVSMSRAGSGDVTKGDEEVVSSVIIDFYLWDLAKRIEGGEHVIDRVETVDALPAHRTRSIWY
ncbi:hypothetical protein A0H81_08634 [Grifola frondosa]|uniref:Queuosine 5'-phosphate N-glycosylase/hydrolase n=1 Tax=Grifola frondosa TaxID=5627 RepID=A0A1C7M3B2_GRIFR|nr:hypothetical protein A0H81_08634 [Grifola frondosa]